MKSNFPGKDSKVMGTVFSPYKRRVFSLSFLLSCITLCFTILSVTKDLSVNGFLFSPPSPTSTSSSLSSSSITSLSPVSIQQGSSSIGRGSLLPFFAAGDGDGGDVKRVKQVTGEELEKELQSWDTPVVLDVYAPWCGPCQLLAPELEHVAGLYKDKLRILKLDSDEEPQVASMLKVYGLPTVLFMKGGKVVYRAEGALPAAEVSRLINLYIFGDGKEEGKDSA